MHGALTDIVRSKVLLQANGSACMGSPSAGNRPLPQFDMNVSSHCPRLSQVVAGNDIASLPHAVISPRPAMLELSWP